MSLFGQLEDFHGDSLVPLSKLRNLRQQDFGVDVSAKFLDLNRLLPELNDADCLLQDLDNSGHQFLHSLAELDGNLATAERQLHNVVIKRRGFPGQALYCVRAPGIGFRSEEHTSE